MYTCVLAEGWVKVMVNRLLLLLLLLLVGIGVEEGGEEERGRNGKEKSNVWL